MHWATSPANEIANGQIAYLKTNDPIDSQRSNYTLWIMDDDGSNGRQLFPPVGENSRFPRYSQFMSWSPTGDGISFVFNDQLYLYDFQSEQASRLTQGDTAVSLPTWAPYGSGLTNTLEQSAPTDETSEDEE